MHQCLLLETPDNRKFFIEENSYPQIVEFSNTFGARISVVETEDNDILDVESLATKLCDPNYTIRGQYQLREKELTWQEHIRDLFLTRKPVKMSELRKYCDDPKLYYIVMSVVKKLTTNGFVIKRIARGTYQMGS